MYSVKGSDVRMMRSKDSIKLNKQIMVIVNDVNVYILDAWEQYLDSQECRDGIMNFIVEIPLNDIINKHITDDLREIFPGVSFWFSVLNKIKGWDLCPICSGDKIKLRFITRE